MDNQNQTTPPQTQSQPHPSGTSEDTKTIVTILLLIFVFPVGLIMMWIWTKWQVWVKVLVTAISVIPALLFLGFIGIFAAGMLIAVNPKEQFEKARQLQLTPAPQIENQTNDTAKNISTLDKLWRPSLSSFTIKLPSDWSAASLDRGSASRIVIFASKVSWEQAHNLEGSQDLTINVWLSEKNEYPTNTNVLSWTTEGNITRSTPILINSKKGLSGFQVEYPTNSQYKETIQKIIEGINFSPSTEEINKAEIIP